MQLSRLRALLPPIALSLLVRTGVTSHPINVRSHLCESSYQLYLLLFTLTRLLFTRDKSVLLALSIKNLRKDTTT